MWLKPESIQPSTWSYCHHKFGWLCFFKIVSKVIIDKSRFEVSLLEQDTIENVS